MVHVHASTYLKTKRGGAWFQLLIAVRKYMILAKNI